MEYNLTTGLIEGKILKDVKDNHMPIPERIQNAPVLRFGLQLFYNIFWELNSARTIGFSIGPIPWNVINDYCNYNDIHGEQRSDVFFMIARLDEAYLRLIKDGKS